MIKPKCPTCGGYLAGLCILEISDILCSCKWHDLKKIPKNGQLEVHFQRLDGAEEVVCLSGLKGFIKIPDFVKRRDSNSIDGIERNFLFSEQHLNIAVYKEA